jgi:hypothetical protein
VMTPVTTPGTASVNAATSDGNVAPDYSQLPDKPIFLTGAASKCMNLLREFGYSPLKYFVKLRLEVMSAGRKAPAVRLKVKSDGSGPVPLPDEVLKDKDALLAYKRCASAVTPILESGLANSKFNFEFSSSPPLDFQGSGSKGSGGRGGGKGGGSSKQSVVALAKHEAEVEDRKEKKAAVVLDKQLLRDQAATELRAKELAVVLAAQEVTSDARFASQEKSHAETLEAMKSAQIAQEAAFKAHLAGLSVGGAAAGSMSPWR